MDKMLSVIAAVISVTGALVTWYAIFRDRGCIKASSSISLGEPDDSLYLIIEIVNSGRRPVFIKYLVKCHKRAKFWCTIASIKAEGLTIEDIVRQQYDLPIVKLCEGEYHRIVVDREDMSTLYINPLNVFANSLHLEDVLGKRYKIKGIKKNIRKFVAK